MGHFEGHYVNIPLDKTSIDQNLLNIANKYKSNPLPWNGQFSPQLVQVLLSHYSTHSDTIFDPFLGSGTTLLEAGELNRPAYGTEINFAAVCLSRIYELINIDFPQRIILMNEFENILIKYGVIYSDVSSNDDINIASNIEKMVKKYFDSEYKILLDCFIVLIDFYKKNFSAKWLEMKWFKIKELIKSLPVSQKIIKPLQADARETSMADSSIDFVITSPPYINVFNYHQQYRSSSEYLNGSVLPSAKAEIGSNRKNRSNRFYTVVQYCIDMSQVLNEINRICKSKSQVVFIVGKESQVKKTTFRNGEIVSEIACVCSNMKLANRQERVFLNRFGVRIYEDILHFQSTKKTTANTIEMAKNISYNLLKSVISDTPEESKFDLKDALNKISEIQPSEIFRNQS
ncbi:MAG: site-specific DNA-methyltransferase [Treponema sp.]|jgi:DNA modification methylase|nr:site-specific DNA-methyltransferase [Treponema sp.]